jgi:hypothetical protein
VCVERELLAEAATHLPLLLEIMKRCAMRLVLDTNKGGNLKKMDTTYCVGGPCRLAVTVRWCSHGDGLRVTQPFYNKCA